MLVNISNIYSIPYNVIINIKTTIKHSHMFSNLFFTFIFLIKKTQKHKNTKIQKYNNIMYGYLYVQYITINITINITMFK